MNIKISKKESETLLNHCLDRFTFGSTNGNDRDWLNIVQTNRQMDAALHNRDHFLFYKEAGVDNLFATSRMIVNSLVTGSSDLPFKMMKEGLFNRYYFKFLHELGEEPFYTYKNAKMLLGCAERDLKQMSKHKEPAKKLKWATIYYDWVCAMLKKGRPELSIDNIRKIRKMAKDLLPPTVSESTLYRLNVVLSRPIMNDIDELDFVGELYFNSWRDSL